MSRAKMSMLKSSEMVYDELKEMYLKKCRANNLSEYTLSSYVNCNKYFSEFVDTSQLKIADISESLLDDFAIWLKETRSIKAITINTYTRHVIPILKYGMELGYIQNFKHKELRQETEIKEIYSDSELKILLQKPSMESFAEYRDWVIINFLLGTGVRANELRHVRVKNINFENGMIILERTKNRKQRFIPMSKTLDAVLIEYLQYRKYENEDEFLFCNVFSDQMPRTTLQMAITKYSKRRGINKYSLHLYRHTFATKWIMNNGNAFQLQRILGHSTMKMVNHYVNMAGEDLKNNIDIFNPLEQFNQDNRETIKIKK